MIIKPVRQEVEYVDDDILRMPTESTMIERIDPYVTQINKLLEPYQSEENKKTVSNNRTIIRDLIDIMIERNQIWIHGEKKALLLDWPDYVYVLARYVDKEKAESFTFTLLHHRSSDEYLNEICFCLDEFRTRLQEFLQTHPWHMYDQKYRGGTLYLNRLCDYRVYSWTKERLGK